MCVALHDMAGPYFLRYDRTAGVVYASDDSAVWVVPARLPKDVAV